MTSPTHKIELRGRRAVTRSFFYKESRILETSLFLEREIGIPYLRLK